MTNIPQLASGLSKAQREMVGCLHGPAPLHLNDWSGDSGGWIGPIKSPAARNLWAKGIAERDMWLGRRWRRSPVPAGYRYRLTPLGLAVRAHLQGSAS